MRKTQTKLEILVRGRKISEYFHEDNFYVEGRPGSEFEILVRNDSAKSRLFIISVDGLSVIDGKPASSDSRGFVVDPYSEIRVPGWLRNNETAARFFFSLSSKKESYAEQMGFGSSNNGVIGVRVFDQKPVIISQEVEFYRTKEIQWGDHYPDLNPVTAASSVPAEIGTGWGNDTEFRTQKTEFQKGIHVEDLVIFYDSIKGLEKRGINVRKKYRAEAYPANPFPGDFCKSPDK